ncbi:hypothetical protein AB2C39_36880, partial [Pseudomonas aeruginosa]
MSEVKRFDVPSMRSLQGEQAVMGYEVVLASDYDTLAAEAQALREEVAALRGAVPEVPPRPPEGGGLPRYGIRFNGQSQPLSVPMDDGYWTPWHLAEALRARVVVTPALRDVSASVDPEYRASATGYNLACADMESLNGLTVSEGLLRRLARP